jgi:hypothetical protein
MSMPAQKPHKSRQDYGTQQPFIDAVISRFGPIIWDLAASRENSKAPERNFIDEDTDSLSIPWHELTGDGWLWLNPPFGMSDRFAEKCV